MDQPTHQAETVVRVNAERFLKENCALVGTSHLIDCDLLMGCKIFEGDDGFTGSLSLMIKPQADDRDEGSNGTIAGGEWDEWSFLRISPHPALFGKDADEGGILLDIFVDHSTYFDAPFLRIGLISLSKFEWRIFTYGDNPDPEIGETSAYNALEILIEKFRKEFGMNVVSPKWMLDYSEQIINRTNL